jgi:hypothetical protein
MVSGLSKPWAVTGDRAPLSVRWEAAATKLAHLGSSLPGPITESNLADALREIGKLSKPVQFDERLNGAKVDLDTAISEHQQLLTKVAFEQRAIARLAETDEFRILGTITDVMLRAPEPTQSVVNRIAPKAPRQPGLALPGAISKPDLRDDVDAWRGAARFVQIENEKLRDLYQDMIKLQQHTVLPSGDQAKLLIFALYSRIGALEDRIDFLEQSATKPKQRRSA